ncbi:MAG: Hsp20/alpha crystallin family protein [Actinomycetota bacterium]|nr:Hsp20/alpha crystallin family protein [Actinomycetota bacterium]
MAERRWDPWREFIRIQDELSRMFQRVFGAGKEMAVPWTPLVDVYEKDDRYIVSVELPDVRPEDIDVSVIDNTLRIKGERKHVYEAKPENYVRSERFYGPFERTIELPMSVKTEEVEATYKDGLLQINLPKVEVKKGKEIKVKAA